MTEIRWDLAQIPNFAGNALQARKMGMAEDQAIADRNALQATQARQIAREDRQDARLATQDGYALEDRKRADLARKADLATKLGLGLKALPPERRAEYLRQQAGYLTQNGLTPQDIQAIPLDDPAIDAGIAQAMSVSDYLGQKNADRTFAAGRDDQQFDRQFKEKQFGETVRSNRVQEGQGAARLGLEGQRVAIARQSAAQAGDGVSKATKATEASLRKEFNALPDVKNYRTVATQAAAVKRLANAPPSANNDIAMVYAVMKSYDPTSVVRETEFATAQNAAGVPDKIRNAYNKALNGQRLNPKQRQEMARTVSSFAETYKQRFDTVANEYRSYAADYSGNPDRVVTVPQEPAAPASGGGAVLRFDARGNRIK